MILSEELIASITREADHPATLFISITLEGPPTFSMADRVRSDDKLMVCFDPRRFPLQVLKMKALWIFSNLIQVQARIHISSKGHDLTLNTSDQWFELASYTEKKAIRISFPSSSCFIFLLRSVLICFCVLLHCSSNLVLDCINQQCDLVHTN